jgi:hypothetical protein
MTSTTMTDDRRPMHAAEAINVPRLRALIESWERDGLIRPDVAAEALRPETRHTAPTTATAPVRRLEVIGYLGTIPVAAAGLLLAASNAGPGSLLLIGLLIALAAPRVMRIGSIRTITPRGGDSAPRHRATSDPRVEIRGPKTCEVMLNGSYGARRRTINLTSTNNR